MSQGKASLEKYLGSIGHTVKNGRTECPLCQGKGTFDMSQGEVGGKAYWKCHKGSCPSVELKGGLDLAALMMARDGLSFADVADELGVSKPKRPMRHGSSPKVKTTGIDWSVAFELMRDSHPGRERALNEWATEKRGWPADLLLSRNPDLAPWPEGFSGQASAHESMWIPKAAANAHSYLWVAMRDATGQIVSAQRAMMTDAGVLEKRVLSNESRRVEGMACFGDIPLVVQSPDVYICEGMADYVAGCILWGRDRVIGVLSTGTMKSTVNALIKAAKLQRAKPTFHFVPDDDRSGAGLKAAEEGAELLMAYNVYFVKTRHGDLSDALRANGLVCTSKFDMQWQFAEGRLVYPVVYTEATAPTKKRIGQPVHNRKENLAALLDHIGVHLRSNLMTHRREVTWPGDEVRTDNETDAEIRTRGMALGLNPGKQSFEDGMLVIAREGAYHPAREWILSKPWDGRDRRVDLWASIHTQEWFSDELAAILTHRWALQCVAALFSPEGSKSEGVLTLCGDQGSFKTRWFESLAEVGVKSGLSINPAKKDDVIQATSHWIVELGELDDTIGRASAGRLKAFLSNPEDDIRRSYGRHSDNYARRTTFCATVNEERFLQDHTGNRRFWVVHVEGCNPEHGVDMQQFWAQMLDVWQTDKRCWLTPEELELLNSSNVNHMEEDPFEAAILHEYKVTKDPTAFESKADIVKRVREHFSVWGRREIVSLGRALRCVCGKTRPIKRKGYEYWPLTRRSLF